MKKDFEILLSLTKETISDYKFYTDFEKVYANVEKFEVELNILNTLLGSQNIKEDFIKIINEYPDTIKVLPLLLAVRDKTIKVFDNQLTNFKFTRKTMSDDYYVTFMEKTELFNFFENKKIKNLIDYIMGVEVGLDSNARKNRTGKTMENIVESFIGQTNHIEYHKQMTKIAILKKYNIDLDELLNKDNDKFDAEKRFDFVIKTQENLYLIEVNFYNSGGSKLNETARSYMSLGQKIDKLPNIHFIWITDGKGWKTAKNNLKETYENIEHLYTLYDLENWVLDKVIK